MASTDAIAATTTGLLALLLQEYDASRFGGREAEFSPDLQSLSFGVSVVLSHVEVAGGQRQAAPQRRPPDGLAPPPSLVLDLHYLMTAWATEPVDEQRLLGWAIRVLHDLPVLSSTLLNTRLPETFGPSETAVVTAEPLLRTDPARQHVPSGAHVRPSVGYVVRGVMVDAP